MLTYEMTREEFNDHVEATGAELYSVDENGVETWVCCYVGKPTVMGRYCPKTESADLDLI